MSTLPDRRWASTAALGVGDRLRERLLDEAVLARLEHAHGQLGVRRHRGGEHDGVEVGVAEQVVEVGGEARLAELAREALAHLVAPVAAPAQLGVGQRVEVAREVRAPVAQAHDPDGQRRVAHSSTVRRAPAPRVTPRRSTTSGARSAMASWSTPGWAVTMSARSAPSSASSKPRLLPGRLGQRRHVRVVVDDVGAEPAEQRQDLQRGRLADVADARLVADAEDRDPAALAPACRPR